MARGGFVGVVVRLAQHGEEFGRDVVDVVCGLFSGRYGRRLPGRGKEVHDPQAPGRGSVGHGTAHEDPEQLARPLIHDLDAAPLRGTEVEQRVPEGEIEDVAPGFLELLPDGGEVGHVPEPALRGNPAGRTGGGIGRCPALSTLGWEGRNGEEGAGIEAHDARVGDGCQTDRSCRRRFQCSSRCATELPQTAAALLVRDGRVTIAFLSPRTGTSPCRDIRSPPATPTNSESPSREPGLRSGVAFSSRRR